MLTVCVIQSYTTLTRINTSGYPSPQSPAPHETIPTTEFPLSNAPPESPAMSCCRDTNEIYFTTQIRANVKVNFTETNACMGGVSAKFLVKNEFSIFCSMTRSTIRIRQRCDIQHLKCVRPWWSIWSGSTPAGNDSILATTNMRRS